MTDGIRDALGMDSKNRENRDGETVVEASELRTLRQQLHQERERAERAELRVDELKEALKEVMNSYENYALMDKHEIEMDEYDLWMKEKWDEARRALEQE